MRAYIGVHISYTFLIISALVVLYLRVNVIKSPFIMSVFIAIILIGQGGLCRALSRFSFLVNGKEITVKTRVFWNIFPFFYLILAIVQLLLWNTNYTLFPILTGVFSFVSISIWFSIRNTTPDENNYFENKKLWIVFSIFTISVICIEMGLKFFLGFLGEFTINIPIIFISWNFLTIVQMNRHFSLQSSLVPDSHNKFRDWQLTAREVEISLAIMRGDSNKVIASVLSISESTVKNHISNIYKKTGAKSRVDLVNLAK